MAGRTTAVSRDGAAPVVHLHVLGGFRLLAGESVLGPRDLGGGRPRQVFVILALHPGHVVTKARLVEMLWEGRDPADATATLESYVSVLRSRLRAATGRTDLVRTAVGGYVVDRGLVEVDLLRVSQQVGQALRAGPLACLELLEAVLESAAAPALTEEGRHEWAEAFRADHARTFLLAAVSAADAALRLGALDRALVLAGRVLAVEPLNEAAWDVRLTALERSGRHAEALQEYARLREVVAAELGCEPGPLLRATAARLVEGASGHDDVGPLVAALLRVHDHTVRNGSGAPVPRDVRDALAVIHGLLSHVGDTHPSGPGRQGGRRPGHARTVLRSR